MSKTDPWLLLLAVALVGAGGCAPSSEAPVEEVEEADPLEAIACANFRWVDHPGVANRAAMTVPVIVGGATLGFQLDTGVEETMIPGGSAAKHRIATHRDEASGKTFTDPMDLKLVGVDYPALQILVDSDLERSEPPGTIGLDLLAGKVVVLDLPFTRFCVTDPEAPGVATLLEKTEFTPAQLSDGKLFVEVRLGEETLQRMLFDTGASAFPLQVDQERWKRLTGREGNEDSNTLWEVSTRGETVTFVGAPSLEALRIGPIALDVPMVFYRRDRPAAFAKWPFPIDGLMGNALFFEHTLVLDLREGSPRFGILPGRIP